MACDIETTGLSFQKDSILGVALAWREDGLIKAHYFTLAEAVAGGVREILSSNLIVGHNFKFDYKFLRTAGLMDDLTPRHLARPRRCGGAWEDTKLLATLIDENTPHDLKWLSQKYLGRKSLSAKAALDAHLQAIGLTIKDLGDARVNQDLVAAYAIEDVVNTLRLHEKLHASMTPAWRQYYTEEMLPCEYVLAMMELSGTRINERHLRDCEEELSRRIMTIATELDSMTQEEREQVVDNLWEKLRGKKKSEKGKARVVRPEFNWASTAQKVDLFYNTPLALGRYVTAVTEGGEPSLNKKDVRRAKVKDPRLAAILARYFDWQAYQKMLTTYCVGLRERAVGSRIHGEYYQVSSESFGKEAGGGTVTGRLSHRNPNLGNLPRGSDDYYKGAFVKDAFVPEDGHVFLYADFKQIELRVAAELAGDKTFIESFLAGEDPHQSTAQAVGVTRQQAKTVNFLIAYGGSAWRLAYELDLNPHIPADLNRCEKIRADFFHTHAQLDAWIKAVRQKAIKSGFVETCFGIRRRLPFAQGLDEERKDHALKQAVNFMVQSTAVSLCKRAMIDLMQRGFVVRNQVHDSIICEAPEGQAEDLLAEMMVVMESQGVKAGFKIPMPADGKILRTFNEQSEMKRKGNNECHDGTGQVSANL